MINQSSGVLFLKIPNLETSLATTNMLVIIKVMVVTQKTSSLRDGKWSVDVDIVYVYISDVCRTSGSIVFGILNKFNNSSSHVCV